MICWQDKPPLPPFADDVHYGGNARTWLRPQGICGFSGEKLFPLTDTGLGFSHCDVLQRHNGRFTVSRIPAASLLDHAEQGSIEAAEMAQRWLTRITTPRYSFAGLSLNRFRIMGIINATPDSFSDGGDHFESDVAVAAAVEMTQAGAEIIDIGGESTRPGADAVSSDEECRRILPIIEELAGRGYCLSADTRHKKVMEAALDRGARLINDVSGLGDQGAADLIAKRSCSVIIMHMQGEPSSMQTAPRYQFAPADIYDWFDRRIEQAVVEGLPRAQIAIDIGFGFGKTPQHNMQLMAWISMFHGLGVPIMLGVSRKSTIARLSRDEAVKERLGGSLSLATLGYAQGVQMFRVHDVPETRQALVLAEAVRLHEVKIDVST